MLPRLERAFERFRRKGDPKAFARFFDRSAPDLYRLAMRLCGNSADAEDAVSQTYLSLLCDPSGWDGQRPLLPWLFGVLANRVREARRRSRREVDAERLQRQIVDDPVDTLSRAELQQALHAEVAALPSHYRRVVEAHLFEDRPLVEIARTEGISPGTLRMRFSRGMQMLRSRLPRATALGGGFSTQVPSAVLARMRAAVVSQSAAVIPTALTAATFVTLSSWLTMNKKLLICACALLATGLGAHLLSEPVEPQESPLPNATIAERVALAGDSPRESSDPSSNSARVKPSVPVLEARPRPDEPATGRIRIRVQERGSSRALPYVPVEGESGGRILGSKFTDEAGNVLYENVAVGACEIRVASHRGIDVAESVLARGTVNAGEVCDLVLEFPTVRRVDVQVVDAEGRTVPGATVRLRNWFDDNTAWRTAGQTDPNGMLELPLIDSGFSLVAWVPGVVHSDTAHVAADAEDRGPIRLALGGRAMNLTGKLRDADGATVPDAKVALWSARAKNLNHHSPLVLDGDAGGAFEFPALAEGDYFALAWRKGDPRRGIASEIVSIQVRSGARNEVELQIAPSCVVRGRVDGLTPDSAGGATLSFASQDARVWSGLLNELTGYARIGSDGEFTAHCPLSGVHLASLRCDGFSKSQSIELVRGSETRLEFLADTTHVLDVTLVDAESNPLSGWRLVATDPDRQEVPAMTDDRGHAELGLPGAALRELRAFAPAAAFPSVTVADVDPRRGELRVEIGADRMATASVVGHVRWSGAEHHGSLRARLFSAESAAVAEFEIDHANRSFHFAALPPGRYTLAIEHDGKRLVHQELEELAPGMALDLGTIDLALPADIHLAIAGGVPREGARLELFVRNPRGGPFFAMPVERVGRDLVLRSVPAAVIPVSVWGEDCAPLVFEIRGGGEQSRTLPITLEAAPTFTLRLRGDLREVATLRWLDGNGQAVFEEFLRRGVDLELVRGIPSRIRSVEVVLQSGGRRSVSLETGPDAPRTVELRVSD
ncbi:MAG: RNA polymerase sigma factor [Planctomycetota bacterium]